MELNQACSDMNHYDSYSRGVGTVQFNVLISNVFLSKHMLFVNIVDGKEANISM